tara:strand:+ start:77 stop:892 length:816 start_codon:yes stop_codon:yes gene_type:complete
MKCDCCGGEYVQILSFKTTEPWEMLKDVYRCNKCSHIYRNYSGDSTEYHVNFYRDGEQGTRGEGEITKEKVTQRFHDSRAKICKGRVHIIKDYIDVGDTCLDVGAGAGTFANFLKKHVKSVDCTELDPRLINECKNLGFKAYEGDFLKIDFENKYDIVFLWHVLEHIEDVNEVMRKIYEICNKRVFIEVPTLLTLLDMAADGETRRGPPVYPPPFRRGYRRLSSPNKGHYDGHCHYFSQESFKELAKNHNFKIKELKEGVQTPALFALLEK